MNLLLKDYKARLLESLLRFLWRQWSALGVAGHASSDDPWMIDPEALLLFSTSIARYDARLFDEVFDWLHRNGSWINLQRLGRMQKEEKFGEPSVLAAMARHLLKDSSLSKWKSLTGHEFEKENEKAFHGPLFIGLPETKNMDETFARYGWIRPEPDLRGMSKSPRPDRPANFLFKLRALLGRQARAEIFAWMLTHEQGHPAEVARQVGYYRRTVQQVLNELSESGHVRTFRSGREKYFAINHREWRFLIPGAGAETFPAWINWAPLFTALQFFLSTLSKPGFDEDSERFQSIQLRQALQNSLPALIRAGIVKDLKATENLQGSDFIEAVLSDLETILRIINADD
jgi:hypothetical protein